MAFVGTKTLTQILTGSDVITPFNPKKIKNGAYELSLGAQVFQTDSSPRAVKELADNEKIEIKPGQFALLLTKEYVKIPETKIAFISIKAGVKFKGLVNVSGFHVDPGFEGNLLFSVYNAGPASIVLSNGTSYFPMWFADIDEKQNYEGNHDKQTRIPDEPVEALSQGELASPNVLSQRIDDVKHIKSTNEWILRIGLGLAIAIGIKLWWDKQQIDKAIDYGYNKGVKEVVSDTIYVKMQNEIDTNRLVFDSLYKNMLRKVDTLSNKVDSLLHLNNPNQ